MPADFSGLIGIDLGTTFSCVAQLSRDGIPKTIPNREGELITPTVLLIEDDMVIVGREAKRSECVAPERTAVCVKRDMGSQFFSHTLGGRQYRPEILSAMILKRLKVDAEARIGPVKYAVITVPAYFDDTRRKATQDAGRIAGLNVIDIINEPTAAALAYAFDVHLRRQGQSDAFAGGITPGESTVLVYDLGGGTFDVSIVRMTPRRFETLATDGDVRLGGRDWDERLVNHVAEQFLKEHGSDPRKDPESRAFLFQAAEQAKHALSLRNSTKILVVHDARRMSVDVTREQFDRMTSSLLTRTQMTSELVVESAGLTWSDIDRVLLVGGMTRAPQVREMIKKMTGREPDVSLAADEVVAHGAAIHGGMLLTRSQGEAAQGSPPHGTASHGTADAGYAQDVSGQGASGTMQSWASFSTVDVNSHSLGIAVRSGAGYANSILIPKNTQLPVSRSKIYRTGKPDQRQVRVRILEGEAEQAEACVQIGEFLIQNLPPNLPDRSPIEVECRYGSDGRISVTGRDLTSGKLAETIIVGQGVLRDDEVLEEAGRLDALAIV